MRCLYCGREIGAFKLRRDREFCSADHRREYGDRLNKALHQLSGPEAPPAGVADFTVRWPEQNGSVLPTLVRWATKPEYPIYALRLSVSLADPDDSQPQDPPLCQRWAPALQPEPVALFVRSSAAAPACGAAALKLPAWSLEKPSTVQVPPVQRQLARIAAAEPVALFVRSSVESHIPYTVQSPALGFAIAGEPRVTEPFTECMRAPAAEPVAMWVTTAASAEFASRAASAALRPLQLDAALEEPVAPENDFVPAPCAQWMPGPAAEPVAQMVWPGAAGEPCFTEISALLRGVSSALPVLPKLHGPAAGTVALEIPKAEPVSCMVVSSSAEIVSLASPSALPEFAIPPALAPAFDDSAFEVPPACEAWMRSPEPEPVFSFLHWSVARESFPEMALSLPAPLLALAGTWMPSVEAAVRVPSPEPVMAVVQSRAADTPLDLVASAAQLRVPGLEVFLPAVETPSAPRPQVAACASGPAADPVESYLQAATSLVPAVAAHGAQRIPESAPAALVASQPLPALAEAAPGLPAVEVESWLVSSAAEVATFGEELQMPRFEIGASPNQISAEFDRQRIAPPVAEPKKPGKVVLLRPIRTIGMAQPEHRAEEPQTSVPQPEFILVEYHAQRLRSEPVCQFPWQAPHIKPVPPKFAIRPILERIEEELATQKPARKEPAFAEVFTMPEAKKVAQRKLGFASKAIAAALVLGGVWLGTSVVRLSRQTFSARQTEYSAPSIPAPEPVLSANSQTGSATPGKPAETGMMASLRRTIANRATYQAGDNFHNGMQAWGAAAGSYAAGWQKAGDGSVSLGPLALFQPSLKLSDYRFEFFGQVEKNGMGWAVRAKDTDNYYAVKVKVLEAGLRPIIAVIHYAVVDGKESHRVETPLNVMVHNNQPFQVAVNVKGNRFSAAIEGEEVDSWSDDRLSSGGVGFFADAGEKARLYWMKVTRNDDWLGHVCGMLAGDDSARVTSELWGTGSGDPAQGGVPGSGLPATAGDSTLAAAGFALSGLRVRPNSKKRYRRWNS